MHPFYGIKKVQGKCALQLVLDWQKHTPSLNFIVNCTIFIFNFWTYCCPL